MENVKTLKNHNGEQYYSRYNKNGEREYSFSIDFEDIWTDAEEDYINDMEANNID